MDELSFNRHVVCYGGGTDDNTPPSFLLFPWSRRPTPRSYNNTNNGSQIQQLGSKKEGERGGRRGRTCQRYYRYGIQMTAPSQGNVSPLEIEE